MKVIESEEKRYLNTKSKHMKGLNINTTILETKDYLTIEDLAEALKVSQYTIYRISNKGELKPYKFMRRNYWKSNEVIGYLNSKGILTNETVS